ncbi:MAG: glycosyltransferase family 2 protein [Myxococcales bacterium]
MPKLSVIVIAKDEERDLPGCLASVAFADEIVVVDAESTDRTREVAQAAGPKVRVVVRPWPGHAAQKAFALSQATGDWVLSLDADERCSQELQEAIPKLVAASDVDGYLVLFQTWAFGRRQRFGGRWSERHLRLFRREKATFPAREIHESAEVAGRIVKVDAPILHHAVRTLDELVEKVNRYSTLGALERFKKGKRFTVLSYFRLPWGFFKRYVLWLGVLDGWDGYVQARLGATYDFLKVAKLRDLERGADPALPP